MTPTIWALIILSVGVLALIVMAAIALGRLSRLQQGDAAGAVREEFRLGREESSKESRALREEVARSQKESLDSVIAAFAHLSEDQKVRLGEVTSGLNNLLKAHREESDKTRARIEAQMKEIREGNEKKLEQMRQTVDEKLQATLEQRLGESFKLVSERLEAVQQGLGEMKSLATGVGDLKRVLTNVKARGTWGEIQLGAILEQVLTPDQYSAKVRVRENTQEQVEFAIRLPGRSDQHDQPVWLPIDSKFPKEDYERLVEASQAGDVEGMQDATSALLREIHRCAKEISEKYVNPPMTTDFAIMFLPTEGLYAEVLRQPGLQDQIQQKYRVLPAGPTTLAALLNSLRMGFRTLAIEKRSSEVWQILAAVKTEFGKFGDVLDKVKKQLATATTTLEETSTRTRAVERKLRTVESLPEIKSAEVLQIPDAIQTAEDEAAEDDS